MASDLDLHTADFVSDDDFESEETEYEDDEDEVLQPQSDDRDDIDQHDEGAGYNPQGTTADTGAPAKHSTM